MKEEFYKVLINMKDGKSKGIYKIPAELLRNVGEHETSTVYKIIRLHDFF